MKISFKGNLGKNAVLRTVTINEQEVKVCSFWVAENRKNRDGSQKKPLWHQVTIWRKYAEVMAPYLKSGRRIEVTGTLNDVKTYTSKDNRIVAYNDIWADELELLDRPTHDGDVPPEVAEADNAEVADEEMETPW